jgi:outer membrane protein
LFGCIPQPQSFDYRHLIELPENISQQIEPTFKHNEIPPQFTLQEAIKIALSANPQVDETLARIRQAEAVIGEVNAEFLPVIATQTSYVYADAPSVYLFKKIDQRTFKSTTNFNYPGIISNFESGLSIAANIYRGGRSILNRWKAETGKDIKCIDHMTLRNVLTSAVIEAYYNCLALSEAVAVMKVAEQMIKQEVEIADNQLEEGTLMRSDLLFLKVRHAESKEEVIKAQNSLQLAFSSLANLLGGDADTKIDIVEEMEDWIPLPSNYESALALALSVRPELLGARKQVEMAAIDLEIARRDFLPTVDVFGKVYWDDPHLQYAAKRTNWETGFGLTWSLYDGNKRYYSIEKSNEILQELLAQDRKTTLAIQLDIKQAFLNYESVQARIAASDISLEHATENLRVVREEYLEGARSVTDYLEAEIMYTQTRLRKIQAFFDLKKAKAAIAMSAGLFSIVMRNE